MMSDENFNLVKEIFEKAAFVRALGIELTSFGRGWCETQMALSPSLRQQHGLVHAGAIMTLADHSCGGAAASAVPEGQDVITVENKVSFLRPASGDLVCRAEVLRAGKRLVFVEATVTERSQRESLLVAKASSTLAVIEKPKS